MSGLEATDAILIEQVVANEAPSVGVAYLLAIFLGLFSGHRFYLGRPISAILQIISYIFFVGLFWLVIDFFLIPGMVRQKRESIRTRELQKMLLNRGSESQPTAQTQEPAVSSALVDRILAEGRAS